MNGYYIVKKGKMYLFGVYPESSDKKPRWTNSPYDAAPIFTKYEANRVANRVDGEVYRFIPATGNVYQEQYLKEE